MVNVMTLDLGDLQSVRLFAIEFCAQHPRLDILVRPRLRCQPMIICYPSSLQTPRCVSTRVVRGGGSSCVRLCGIRLVFCCCYAHHPRMVTI